MSLSMSLLEMLLIIIKDAISVEWDLSLTCLCCFPDISGIKFNWNLQRVILLQKIAEASKQEALNKGQLTLGACGCCYYC